VNRDICCQISIKLSLFIARCHVDMNFKKISGCALCLNRFFNEAF